MNNSQYDLIWWVGCLVVACGMVYVTAHLAWNRQRSRRMRRRLERAARPTPGLPLETLGCLLGSQWKVGEMASHSLQTAARIALPLLRAEVRRLASDTAAYNAGDEDCRDAAEKTEMLKDAIQGLEILVAASDVILITAPENDRRAGPADWREAAEKLDTEDE